MMCEIFSHNFKIIMNEQIKHIFVICIFILINNDNHVPLIPFLSVLFPSPSTTTIFHQKFVDGEKKEPTTSFAQYYKNITQNI